MTQHARPIGPTTNAAATFEPSMVQGSAPSRPWNAQSERFMYARRAGWMTAQTTPVAAPFTPDMAQGVTAPRNREHLAPRCDYAMIPPTVPVFSVEMVVGSVPDRGRSFLAPRMPLPLSQTTHGASAFGPEMVAGDKPVAPRPPFMAKTGWSASQSTPVAAPVTVDMLVGARLDRNRERLAPRLGVVSRPPDVQSFSVEMATGSTPGRPRLFLAPKLPLPQSQPTHVPGAFSLDMVAGYQARKGLWITHQDIIGVLSVAVDLAFNPAWAANSNRTVGMDIQPT